MIINGRARHPQTQGLIERGNRTLEVALGKWMQHYQSDEWTKGNYLFMCLLDLTTSDIFLKV